MSDWVLAGLWAALSLYWGWEGRRSPAVAARARDPLYRWNLIGTVAGILLMVTAAGDIWILGTPLVRGGRLAWCGLAIALAGFALAIWSRRLLGRNWSSRIERKEGHRLITSGPYALIRHPIYAGIMLSAIGSALADNDFGAVIGCVLLIASLLLKLRLEERFVAASFGDEWLEWRRQTWALVPGLF